MSRSPTFTHQKSSGYQTTSIDLSRLNHLPSHDTLNSDFSISSLTDATNLFAGKGLFSKLNCSQIYHCVQLADDRSVQPLASN